MKKLTMLFSTIAMLCICAHADTTNAQMERQTDTTKEVIKTNYQFSILASTENDSTHMIIVEWLTGEIHTSHATVCKKILVSYRLNQYLLCIGNEYNTVIVIPINTVFFLKFYTIETKEARAQNLN